MRKNNLFQKILMGVFGFMGILGVLAFAGYIPGFSSERESKSEVAKIYGDVLIWGTLPASSFDSILNEYNKDEKRIKFTYHQKNELTMNNELLEALVLGQGPDILLIPHDWFTFYVDKLIPVPYSPTFEGEIAVPERSYKDTYLEAAEIYLYDEGILSFPISINPLVMYWNRDILSSYGISRVPKTWDEFNSIVPKVTILDSDGNIIRSATAMGEYNNITNSKEILSLLLMQAGVPIAQKQGSSIEVSMRGLDKNNTGSDAIKFFMQFSNPQSDLYTWNRSLEDSRDMFISGDLAFYFGYASEVRQIQAMNPRLNFDVTMVPQSRINDIRITYGRLYGVSVVKDTRNIGGAKWGVLQLASKEFATLLNNAYKLPPVRRDLIDFYGATSEDTTFQEAALITRVWADPEPNKSSQIFADMIQDIMSDRFGIAHSLSAVERKLESLFK